MVLLTFRTTKNISWQKSRFNLWQLFSAKSMTLKWGIRYLLKYINPALPWIKLGFVIQSTKTQELTKNSGSYSKLENAKKDFNLPHMVHGSNITSVITDIVSHKKSLDQFRFWRIKTRKFGKKKKNSDLS